MSKRPNWKMPVVLLSCVIFISGCVETKQLEKLGLITAIGYDLERENEIKGTVIVHKFDPVAQNVTKVITADAHTSKRLRQKQNLETDQKLVSGQLRCAVYSKDLAKKGIIQLVDALNRDPTIGNTVYLMVAEGDASEIMKIDQEKIKVNLGTYLYNLIKQNVESEQLLLPTLFEFNHSYDDRGKDPVLPILKYKKDNVVVTGAALFQDDRYITELRTDKLFYLKVLSDKFKAGSHELNFPRSRFKSIIDVKEGTTIRSVYNKLFINIDNIRSHSKIILVDKNKPSFKVEVELASRLLEATEQLNISNPENIKFIEKEISKEMEKEIKNMLLFFQKNQVDPVGFGNKYFAKLRGKPPTTKEWREVYKHATFEIKVKNTIVKTGVND